MYVLNIIHKFFKIEKDYFLFKRNTFRRRKYIGTKIFKKYLNINKKIKKNKKIMELIKK